MVEAEAAVGFAPEGVGKCCFGVEEERSQAVEPCTLRLAALDEPPAFVDERNDEQPEAREHTAKGRKIAQQPGWCAAFVFHALGAYPGK